jgi:eukaryotic-like serine/threonine-protein kinase
MQPMLRPGQTVQLLTYRVVGEVDGLLGAGGQGEVYRLRVPQPAPARHFALKWYFSQWRRSDQWETLQRLVKQNAPNPRFLWPLDLVTAEEPGFGYLMRLRGSNFRSIAEVMKGVVSPTFRSLATTGFELADGFLQLHSAGYCYRDISFGNMFLDPASGEVLICDNDNVGIDGRAAVGVRGTNKFMAPEVVRGEAVPSTATDLFSLSVLLFYLLMVHHPLEGRRELAEPCLDVGASYRLYGERPVFIFDPDDHSNEPVVGAHDNALTYWPLYPGFLRELFVRAFTVGLRDARNGRVRETEWRRAMVRLRDAIVYCPRCPAENVWDEDAPAMPSCWRCRAPVKLPPRLVVDGDAVMLNHDTRLFPHHLRVRPYDFSQAVAMVARRPEPPTVWGLKNLGDTPWTAVTPDHGIVEVAPGRSVTLVPGTRLRFGTAEGVITAD